MDEESLLQHLLARDPIALELLLARYTDDVHAVVSHVLGRGAAQQDVEEASAEAFLAAWDGARKYDPGRAPIHTWLLMHAKYAALEQRRRLRRWLRPGSEFAGAGPEDPLAALASRDERQRIEAALRQLPDLDREIVYRRYFLDEDIGRLAASLGLSRGAVDNRLWRAKGVLRRLLSEDDAIAREGSGHRESR